MDEKQNEQGARGQDVPEGAVEIPVEIVSDADDQDQLYQEQEPQDDGQDDMQDDMQDVEEPADPDDAAAQDELNQEEAEQEEPEVPQDQAGQDDCPETGGEDAGQAQRSSWRWPWQKGDKQDGAKEAAPTVESLLAELEAVKKETAEQLKAAQEEVKSIQLRSLADFENYKKRLSREHDEHLKYAAETVMKDLIPTLDNLELAITYGSSDEACANMMQGVQMTQKLLLDALAKHGLTRVGQEGEPFDPAKHEAIGCESRPEYEPETVARVLQSGYDLSGRLLRPAKVMVNRP